MDPVDSTVNRRYLNSAVGGSPEYAVPIVKSIPLSPLLLRHGDRAYYNMVALCRGRHILE